MTVLNKEDYTPEQHRKMMDKLFGGPGGGWGDEKKTADDKTVERRIDRFMQKFKELQRAGSCGQVDDGTFGPGNTCAVKDGAHAKTSAGKKAGDKGPAGIQPRKSVGVLGERVVKTAKPYRANPTLDGDGDGLTDASRVGLAGNVVPPPPKTIPRMPNLTKDEREVEDAFAKKFESDPEGETDKFYDMIVNKEYDPDDPLAHKQFGMDDAKWLSSHYASRPEARSAYNIAVHQTANAIAKRAFVKHLDTLKKGDRVLITQGGVASGKGFACKNFFSKEQADKFGAVWDSAGEQNGTEMPWIQKELESRGLIGDYVYVHSDPLKAQHTGWKAAFSRAVKKGRMVDAKLFAESYHVGSKNFDAFRKKHKGNKSASFVILDKLKPVKSIPTSEIPQDLEKQAIEQLLKSGQPGWLKRGGVIGARIWRGGKNDG